MSDVFNGVGQQIVLYNNDDFLKIKETLTRIGVVEDENKLIQVCYILHKRGKYAILHEKELLKLDGNSSPLTENEINQRQAIAILLQQWKLLTISPPTDSSVTLMYGLKVIPYKERNKWEFISQYSIGRKYSANSSK